MKRKQHTQAHVHGSFVGIPNAVNLTCGLYLKNNWKRRAHRLMLGIAMISCVVSITVAVITALLILTFTG
jgi:hypothetical protein